MGGLGDAFIVFTKLQTIMLESPPHPIEWTHVESNETVPELLEQFLHSKFAFFYWRFERNFICDADYVNKFQSAIINPKDTTNRYTNYIKNSHCLNTSWDGSKEIFHIKDPDGFEQMPFLFTDLSRYKKQYDIAIQVDAGAKSNRKWNFNPLGLAKILRTKGYKVCLVGHNKDFFDDKDDDNFVCKLDLKDSLDKIVNVDCFIGLNGFYTFVNMASRVDTIFFEESPQHTEQYVCPQWRQYMHRCSYGSLNEVVFHLKKLGFNV